MTSALMLASASDTKDPDHTHAQSRTLSPESGSGPGSAAGHAGGLALVADRLKDAPQVELRLGQHFAQRVDGRQGKPCSRAKPRVRCWGRGTARSSTASG